ncbi:conserved protein of unknown function [Latilactobacillus sakei]|uniref:reverse transcriptase domain-containing protein n=2 Tax=Latilactobacillus sakei TaxID=1599 RepID=UPI000C6F2658|nr:reverse transcriptase domain-containing protein [Latilactobacillus sakei]MCP8854452.1 hypothetical protein [Latilactobacillus sakei]SON66206.1 conserved protein of unknown function [Latilactobacillus sakei]
MDTTKQELLIYERVLNKSYRQFDATLTEKSALKFIDSIVNKPDEVARYRFLPFIVYTQNLNKYHRSKGYLRAHLKKKKRPISLVAHHDALIYVKYSEKLNYKYEQYLADNNIEHIPTAYRKSLHQSNIDAAKEVFDFIEKSNESWIIKGDFKGFFDNLRYSTLRNNLCEVLDVDELSKDWNAVFKSLTRYRSVNSGELVEALKKAGIKNNQERPYIDSRKEIKKLITKGGLRVHGPNQIGIPQGTSLSAVLANVYMINFDKKMDHIISKEMGLYRRYSDDFVIVIPKDKKSEFDIEELINTVRTLSKKETKLEIEKHKTKTFNYNINNTNKIELRDETKNSRWFDYLGFIFNGDVVRIRDKSIYKFHYKSKKAINLFTRIENDRDKIKRGTIPNPENKKELVWKDNHKVFKSIHSRVKQEQFKKRIEHTKKNYNYNLTQTQLATKMYLIPRRYGEYYSMTGYAKRAQLILSKESRYKVEVLEQIMNQIRKNQKYVHDIRKNNN